LRLDFEDTDEELVLAAKALVESAERHTGAFGDLPLPHGVEPALGGEL
jgi:hypothetical protein